MADTRFNINSNEYLPLRDVVFNTLRDAILTGKLVPGERLMENQLAEKLGVSRQTVSKWETDETVPDIRQSKKMAVLYHVSLDELIDFDLDFREIQEAIDRTSEEVEAKINWTNAWGKKYPILLKYQADVNIPNYARRINIMLDELKQDYGFSEQDAMLVLKDILYNVWKSRKGNGKRPSKCEK